MLAKSCLKEKPLGSPQKQQGSQITKTRADLGSELRQVQRQHWACTRGKPKPSFLPSQKGGMGKGDKSLQKGSRCPEEKRQKTWDYCCSKTNWLDKWNIMESANSAPLSVHLSPGHFICPSSFQQNKMKCIFYCKLLYSAGCKRLEDFPRGNELTRDCFIL